MRLFWKLVGASVRSQMRYPASFLMLSLGNFLGTCTDLFGIWVLFDRFKMVKGWTLFEVGLIYGIVNMGFALAESFARGFEKFDQTLKTGEFDQVLIRPVSPFLQIAVREVQVMRIGRFLQGLVVLIWSASALSLSLYSLHALIIGLSIAGAACLFYGLFVIQAAVSFWTIETLELMHIATYGGAQSGQYPMSIYNRPFRLIFTFAIPLACVAYYPIAALLGRDLVSIWIGAIAPLSGVAFLCLACRFWNFGMRRYCSTGS